ncbi:class A beta-lactamase [Streptomyces oceani]|uniref:Beta-lactamase n=1 Tax=Streptomyces oceani TaxID=1075402 RepID=A0A1E7KJ86_9ACTN|nr:class A beta-lactamase [Streptomyces oceani]OEV03904.1 class A beta-lactamase [Streptomyces oceani]
MRSTLTRRVAVSVLTPLTLLPLAACGQDASAGEPGSSAESRQRSAAEAGSYAKEFKKLERKYDARLGVYVRDTGTGEELTYHADQRFAYASTFKALAAGAVLDEYSPKEMEKVVHYSEDDLIEHSPITEKHVDTGMSLRALSAAAVRYSDNTAANLLFDALGGPKGLDAKLAALGDDVTQMNRYEPELNEATPGDPRDTTTPRAFAKDLREYVLGDVLPKDDRALLRKWMRTNVTGDALIRAGVPDDWTVADKSGGGGYGTRNNIAIVRPDEGAPLAVSILSSRDTKDAEYDDALIAEAASVVADQFS